jgi:hypothetical protein
MITNRQMLLHAAVFIAFFAATVAVLQWRHVEQPKPRIMLNPSTLVQIEVPLGLMPLPDPLNPAFGMEGGLVTWVDEAHANNLSLIFTGTAPEAWPEVSLLNPVAPRNPWVFFKRDPPAPVGHPGLHGVLAVELDTGPESVRIR